MIVHTCSQIPIRYNVQNRKWEFIHKFQSIGDEDNSTIFSLVCILLKILYNHTRSNYTDKSWNGLNVSKHRQCLVNTRCDWEPRNILEWESTVGRPSRRRVPRGRRICSVRSSKWEREIAGKLVSFYSSASSRSFQNNHSRCHCRANAPTSHLGKLPIPICLC